MPKEKQCDVAIVGAGFAGSLLARLLAIQGRAVVLIDSSTTISSGLKLALGESTTPLANLALERLARRYGQEDLWDLATYGRWKKRLAHLGVGRKRGFTFYSHRAQEDWRAGVDGRLLVAASPDDESSDTQWWRADVDRHLFEQAVIAGVHSIEGTRLHSIEPSKSRGEVASSRLILERDGRAVPPVAARIVVDASGGSAAVARRLGAASRNVASPPTRLHAGWFEGVLPFEEAVATGRLPTDPYRESEAAVHHLTPMGWCYSLRFDHGVTSAGFVARSPAAETAAANASASSGVEEFTRNLSPYPSLRSCFQGARALAPLVLSNAVPRRLDRVAGAGWVALPHVYAFFDPLYSTGIAWSLRAVERLASLLGAGELSTDPCTFGAYARLLACEADHLDELNAGAWKVQGDFARFEHHALLYFAAASFCESRERLVDFRGAQGWAKRGFLGADDTAIRLAVREMFTDPPREAQAYRERIKQLIEPFDVVGWLDADHRREVYPALLEAVLERAAKLGLSPSEAAARRGRMVSGDLMLEAE